MSEEKITSQMRLILKRLAMPEAQIEERLNPITHYAIYEMQWVEDGTRYGCTVTRHLVKKLEALGRIKAEYDRSHSALYTLVDKSG